MKKIALLTILIFLFSAVFSQAKPIGNYYLKLSAGRVSFGSGDFIGYSFLVEGSKNIIKKPSFALYKLLVGGELIFEMV